jgi:hypothetical protein
MSSFNETYMQPLLLLPQPTAKLLHTCIFLSSFISCIFFFLLHFFSAIEGAGWKTPVCGSKFAKEQRVGWFMSNNRVGWFMSNNNKWGFQMISPSQPFCMCDAVTSATN